MLEAKLKALMDEYPAKTSLYCVDLTTGESMAAIREEEKVVSASTIKLPVLLCALQEVMEGRLDLEQFSPSARETTARIQRFFGKNTARTEPP